MEADGIGWFSEELWWEIWDDSNEVRLVWV